MGVALPTRKASPGGKPRSYCVIPHKTALLSLASAFLGKRFYAGQVSRLKRRSSHGLFSVKYCSLLVGGNADGNAFPSLFQVVQRFEDCLFVVVPGRVDTSFNRKDSLYAESERERGLPGRSSKGHTIGPQHCREFLRPLPSGVDSLLQI